MPSWTPSARRAACSCSPTRPFQELHSRLLRPKFDRYVSQRGRLTYLFQLMGVSERTSIAGAKLGCPDPEDGKFLETALAGEADCLITGDRDLLDMTPFRGIPILPPAAFLNSFNTPN